MAMIVIIQTITKKLKQIINRHGFNTLIKSGNKSHCLTHYVRRVFYILFNTRFITISKDQKIIYYAGAIKQGRKVLPRFYCR